MGKVIKQKTVPSIEFSSAKGNFGREEELEDTMLDLLKHFPEGFKEGDVSSSAPKACGDLLHLTKEQPLEDKPPSVVADPERDTLAKETKSKKGIIGSPS